jgi:hypothetical protein
MYRRYRKRTTKKKLAIEESVTVVVPIKTPFMTFQLIFYQFTAYSSSNNTATDSPSLRSLGYKMSGSFSILDSAVKSRIIKE